MLTATFNSHGDRQIPPHTHKIDTPEQITRQSWLRPQGGPKPHLVQIRSLGASGQYLKYSNLKIYTFFFDSRTGQTGWRNFLPPISQKTSNYSRVCLLRVMRLKFIITKPFIYPQNYKFWSKLFFDWTCLTVGTFNSKLPFVIVVVPSRFQIWHFRRRILTPVPTSHQIPKFCITKYIFLLETHCSRHHWCASGTKLLRNLVTGSGLPKTTFRPKLTGVWPKGASRNMGPSIYLCNHWN